MKTSLTKETMEHTPLTFPRVKYVAGRYTLSSLEDTTCFAVLTGQKWCEKKLKRFIKPYVYLQKPGTCVINYTAYVYIINENMLHGITYYCACSE